jgi:pimeloyl-ACP methyl ester carboxylesterase
LNSPADVRPAARDCSLELRGQQLVWREWGNPDAPAVIALHGWLDNAASFDALAVCLDEVRLIAVDLPGHGLSDHRPPSATYNIWDDVPDLSLLADTLGLDRYRVIAHSRGAVIATILAAAEPERVRSLVLLDGMFAPPFDPADTAELLQQFVHDHGRRLFGEGKLFRSIDEAIAARCKASGIDPRAARQLVSRSLKAVDGGYRWRTDPRLRYASALRFSEANSRSILGSVRAPSLLITASRGFEARYREHPLLDALPGLQRLSVDGCHHCHMLEQASQIATEIRHFWNTADAE